MIYQNIHFHCLKIFRNYIKLNMIIYALFIEHKSLSQIVFKLIRKILK